MRALPRINYLNFYSDLANDRDMGHVTVHPPTFSRGVTRLSRNPFAAIIFHFRKHAENPEREVRGGAKRLPLYRTKGLNGQTRHSHTPPTSARRFPAIQFWERSEDVLSGRTSASPLTEGFLINKKIIGHKGLRSNTYNGVCRRWRIMTNADWAF